MAIQPSLQPAGEPVGEPLISTRTYDEATAAVDALADGGFPVAQVAIVGRGVRTVERVTGRSGTARAVGVGALNGALVGVFFGLLFDWWGAISPETGWVWLALWGLAYGALVGAALGALFRGFAGGRHFTSARMLAADRYEVTLTDGDRVEAMRILRAAGLLGGGPA